MMTTQLKNRVLYWVILLGFAYFPLFHQLGRAPVKAWDESLYAMRAYHLQQHGSYLANFDQFPSITHYPNLKPPLGTFLQAGSFQLFGFKAWALRIPIALAAFLLTIILFEFVFRISSSVSLSLFSALFLLSSWGFVREHVARTGDHDVLFLTFMVLQLICYYYFLKNKFEYTYLIFFALSTLGAFFTKSILAFFLFPAYLLYALSERQLGDLIKRKSVYGIGLVTLGIIVGYYALMNILFPGFFQMVWDTVWGRYINVIENHYLSYDFYFNQLIWQGFFPWSFLLPLCIWAYLVQPRPIYKLLGFAFLTHLLLITLSQTKLYWYDALLYPLASLLLAIGLFDLSHYYLANRVKRSIFYSCLVFLSGWAFQMVLSKNLNQAWQEEPDQYGYQMKDTKLQEITANSYTVYGYEYNVQAAFYAQLFNDQQDADIKVITYLEQIPHNLGDFILVCAQEKLDRVNGSYLTEVTHNSGPCNLLQLIQKKDPPNK